MDQEQVQLGPPRSPTPGPAIDASKRFLEVGCATGRWLIYFHRTFGYAVTGCDYSEAGCVEARESLARASIPGDIVQDDLFRLQGRWDVVFSGGLIEHFTDAQGVLGKFTSLLNPGGFLVTIVPNLSGLSGAYHRWLKPETFTTHRVVTAAQLGEWHAALGLRRVEVGALGSVVPSRFPRDAIRRRHPKMYRALWTVLGPLTGRRTARASGDSIEPACGSRVPGSHRTSTPSAR
jgi:SAM-dependent methyltransferase